jgi:hypothetical protein
MSKTLVITVEFDDESDFDAFRQRFVGVCEDEAAELMDDEEAPRADGKIEVGWDVEEES